MLINNDNTILTQVEESLELIHEIYGKIPYMFSIGSNTKVYKN